MLDEGAMKKKIRVMIVVTAAVLLTAGAFFLFFDKIAIAVLSRSFDVEISYDRVWNIHFTEFLFDNLRVFYKKKENGIAAKSASIKPVFTKNFFRSIAFEFLLKDINFIKKETKAEKYDTLDGLLALPFMSQWLYPEVKGRIECFVDRVAVEDFSATGGDIRLNFKGDVFYDKKVKGEVKVHFSKNVLKKVPDELTGILLSDEGEGWRGISVKLDGDYAAPSVQFTGKMFRLSIKNVSTK